MEKSANKLDANLKGEIFENVNTLYLRLKGDKKKQTKRSFKASWKEDNMCYIMMMALNNAYDTWAEQELNEDWLWDLNRIGRDETVSRKEHKRMMNFLGEDIEGLEAELDKVKEGKGYIKEDHHKEQMETQKKEFQEKIRDLGDQVRKWKHRATMEAELRVSEVKMADKQTDFYKKVADQLSAPEK